MASGWHIIGNCHRFAANSVDDIHGRSQFAVASASKAQDYEQRQAEDEEISALMMKFDPLLHFARRFLPADRARDASSLYAWCRRLDEIVDEPGALPTQTLEKLADWEARFEELSTGTPRDALDAALTRTLTDRPSLGRQPFEEMILGMREDIDVDDGSVIRYERFRPDLLRYCYRVAGTVGEMLLPVLGLEGQETTDAAIALGCAVQLLNIVRDVTGDLELRRRIYLPREDVKAVGMSPQELEAAIQQRTCTDRYKRLIRLQVRRAAALLNRAEESLESMTPATALLVALIIDLHRELVSEIQVRDYDNLNGKRVRVSTLGKFRVGASTSLRILLATLTGRPRGSVVIAQKT